MSGSVEAASSGMDRSNSTRTVADSSHYDPLVTRPANIFRMLSAGSWRSRRNDIEPFYGNQVNAVSSKDPALALSMESGSLHAVNQSPDQPGLMMSITRATAGESETDDLEPITELELEHRSSSQMNPPAYTLLPSPVHARTTAARGRPLREPGYGHRRPLPGKGSSVDSHSSYSSAGGSNVGSLSRLIVPSAIPESEDGETNLGRNPSL